MRSVANWLLSRPRLVMVAVALMALSLVFAPAVVEAQLSGSGCAGVTYGCTSGSLPEVQDPAGDYWNSLSDVQQDAWLTLIFWNVVILGFILTGVPII